MAQASPTLTHCNFMQQVHWIISMVQIEIALAHGKYMGWLWRNARSIKEIKAPRWHRKRSAPSPRSQRTCINRAAYQNGGSPGPELSGGDQPLLTHIRLYLSQKWTPVLSHWGWRPYLLPWHSLTYPKKFELRRAVLNTWVPREVYGDKAMRWERAAQIQRPSPWAWRESWEQKWALSSGFIKHSGESQQEVAGLENIYPIRCYSPIFCVESATGCLPLFPLRTPNVVQPHCTSQPVWSPVSWRPVPASAVSRGHISHSLPDYRDLALPWKHGTSF